MAPSKRRPDKDKRYRQNRAQREARAARSARAGEATAISRGERAPESSAATEPGGDTTQARAAGRPGRRKSPWTIPGQRAVVLAFMFSIVSSATLLLAPIQVPRDVPRDDPRVEEEDPDVNDDGTVTIFEDGKLVEEESAPIVGVVLLAPIAITGAAVWFTKRPQRSTAWTMAMLAMAAYVFLVGSYGVIALPSLIALAVGGFQTRRAESKERLAELKAERARRKAGGGEVIDADSVEVDADDEVSDSGRG